MYFWILQMHWVWTPLNSNGLSLGDDGPSALVEITAPWKSLGPSWRQRGSNILIIASHVFITGFARHTHTAPHRKCGQTHTVAILWTNPFAKRICASNRDWGSFFITWLFILCLMSSYVLRRLQPYFHPTHTRWRPQRTWCHGERPHQTSLMRSLEKSWTWICTLKTNMSSPF